MSSPVVNKDTLYYYVSQERGEHCLGFLYKDKFYGWSTYIKNGRTWEWSQTREYSGKPIGQRCILQW